MFWPDVFLFLDEIGCVDSARKVWGCQPDLAHWNGTCICNGYPTYQDKGTFISKLLIDNRIKNDISWMLEPWADGPPYSVSVSYLAICKLLLKRLGCPESDQTIKAGKEGDLTSEYTCACGSYTDATTRTSDLICNQIQSANLMELRVFQDPVTMSIEFSIALVLIVGKLASMLAIACRLPPIVGFLLGGVAIQDIVSQSLINGAGGAVSDIKLH